MENFKYIAVVEKPGRDAEAAAQMLLDSLNEGWAILSAVPTSTAVHYVLMDNLTYQLPGAGHDGHELDEEDMKIIEENIERGIKEIKNG